VSEAIDMAWAAGLFEGEGCFYVNRRRRDERYCAPIAALAMSDKDVVVRFCKIIGCGSIRMERRTQRASHHKALWRWQAHKTDDILLLEEKLVPLLSRRRRMVFAENMKTAIESGWGVKSEAIQQRR
jgi:hypothetical protein